MSSNSSDQGSASTVLYVRVTYPGISFVQQYVTWDEARMLDRIRIYYHGATVDQIDLPTYEKELNRDEPSL